MSRPKLGSVEDCRHERARAWSWTSQFCSSTISNLTMAEATSCDIAPVQPPVGDTVQQTAIATDDSTSVDVVCATSSADVQLTTEGEHPATHTHDARQAEPSSSETQNASEDVGASSSDVGSGDTAAVMVDKLAADVEVKCSTDDAATEEREMSAEHDGSVVTTTDQTAEHDGTGVTTTDQASAGGTNADVADKKATNVDEATEQRLEQSGEETTGTGEDFEAVDAEISFKKQTKHGSEEADPEAQAHDVNRNAEKMSSSCDNKSTCCSA